VSRTLVHTLILSPPLRDELFLLALRQAQGERGIKRVAGELPGTCTYPLVLSLSRMSPRTMCMAIQGSQH
jgi:hypothetical protein